MNPNVFNQAPYLRVQRNFPANDMKELCLQLDKGYIDTASAVNLRTIGIFPTRRPAITGNSYYLTGTKQQSLLQMFVFEAAGSEPHNIKNFADIQFPALYGGFTDGTMWYPLPWVDVVNANRQITINVDAVNVNLIRGLAAPVIQRALIILEWIVQP